MMRIVTLLLALAVVCSQNPGIIVAVPLPYDLSNELIPIPYQLEDFTVEGAEFTNVTIKELQLKRTRLEYKKKTIFIKECLEIVVQLAYMRVHFDYVFEGKSGPGDFQEADAYIVVEFDVVDQSGKPDIVIKRIDMSTGNVKVTLGGSVSERVAAIITKLLLEFGEPAVHTQVKKAIRKEMDKLNKNIKTDFNLLDIKLNSSLVSAPNIQPDWFWLNLNGAAFIEGSGSGVLNPPELIKINTTLKAPQMIIHEQVLNSALNTHFKKTPLNMTISMMKITSTIDINSQALQPAFPAMIQFSKARDVLVTVSQTKSTVNITNSRINILMDLRAIVETEDIKLSRYPYMSPITGTFKITSLLHFGQKRTAFNIDKILKESLNFDQTDINKGNVNPEQILTYYDVLTTWIASGINGELSSKSRAIAVYGIGIPIAGALKEKTINMELRLGDKTLY